MTVFDTNKYGEQRISAAFYAALAKALGATLKDTEDNGYARMTVGSLALVFRQGYGANIRRMSGTAYAADPEAHSRAHRYGRPVKFPECTLDPTRPLDALARDVGKRLIEKSAPALASIAAMDAQQRANESAIEAAATDLRRAFPALRVEVKDTSAQVWASGLTARLDRDGALTFDWLCVSADKAAAILRILTAA